MHRLTQLDVFSDRFMRGNALAVVHDADDLSDEDMAAFARWTQLSETTFLLMPTVVDADYRLRIFTPTGELPFAGHPTIGSARAWLAAGGEPMVDGRLIQECGAGRIEVRQDDERLAFAAPPLIRTGPVAADDLACLMAGIGLPLAAAMDAQWVDNGPGWVAVLLDSAEQVRQIRPDYAAMPGFKLGVIGPQADSADTAFEIRAFVADGQGVEDPVTGSLNAGVARWLIDSGRASSRYVVAQGSQLARRGRVYIDDRDDGLWVGGDCVIGINGRLSL